MKNKRKFSYNKLYNKFIKGGNLTIIGKKKKKIDNFSDINEKKILLIFNFKKF